MSDLSKSIVTYLIDIGRIKEIISIQGVLIETAAKSAKDKKDDLMNLVKHYRSVTMTWGTTKQQTAKGNIQKVGITETPGSIVDGAGSGDAEKNFAVQLAFMIGTDK